MHAVVRIAIEHALFFHLAIYFCMDREKYCMGSYTIASDNTLREKFSGMQTTEDYQWKILMGKMLTN